MSKVIGEPRLEVYAAFYVLFIGQEALIRFPNAMKGTAFPQNLTLPPVIPDNENKTFIVEETPSFLHGKFRVIRRLLSEDALADAFVEVTVSEKCIASLPDIFMVKTPIVNAKARSAIEAFDPDLAFFYPARVSRAKTGDALEGSFWVCMPKYEIFTTQKGNPDAPDYTSVDGPAGKFLPALHWTSGALEHLSQIYPLLTDWGGHPSMNPALFTHLKSAGLTGLTEIPRDAQSRTSIMGETYDAKTEFVSHVRWNRDRNGYPDQ